MITAPKIAPSKVPLPPTATQITISIEKGTVMNWGETIPDWTVYKAPEIPANAPATANIMVLKTTGLYPANLTLGSSSRIPIRIFPKRPLINHFEKYQAAITRNADIQKKYL